MQECRVCDLLFLGGGACPSCGSQVAIDVNTDDIVMDDESIPGLDDIADALVILKTRTRLMQRYFRLAWALKPKLFNHLCHSA